MNNKKEEICILVVSDVHGDSFQFDNIKQISKMNTIHYDYIFYLGDFDSLHQEEQNNPAIVKESIDIISQMLLLLETICPNVYYIGGNHDPGVLFSEKAPSLGKSSKNIHKSYIVIENDLIIAGIGGSTPAIQSDITISPYHNFKIDNYDHIIWNGYPYSNSINKEEVSYMKSDSIYEKDLTELSNKIKSECSSHKIIFLSHSGPFTSHTSNRVKNDKLIYSGSISLNKFINEHSKDILMSLHGHTHLSVGMSKVGNVSVVNPGSLRKGDYCEIKLKRDSKLKWLIKQITFKKIIN